jgi:twitching motility protein PilT
MPEQIKKSSLGALLKTKMVNPEEAYRCAIDKKQFEQYLTPA